MSTPSRLQLPSLRIRGFRGLDDLSIPRLGRVTLLVGRNSVGKTAVLEAVQIYAARGHRAALREILARHDEVIPASGGGDAAAIDWSALFHRGDDCAVDCISIGPAEAGDQLRIERGQPADREPIAGLSLSPRSDGDQVQQAGQQSLSDTESPMPMPCEFVGAAPFDDRYLAQLWDAAVANGYETQAVEALRLIFGDAVQEVALVGGTVGRSAVRRLLVRMEGWSERRPLKSLGDGAIRLFGVTLALMCSKGGFLLIDQAENGLHHSRQREFWRMVLQAAEEHDVQVFATTQGWDCVAGFAVATAKIEAADGLLVRIERGGDGLRVVDYTEQGLEAAALQHIEVR